MRKLLSGGLVVFGIVSVPPLLSPRSAERSPTYEHRGQEPGAHRVDPRIGALRHFFARPDCLAAEYAEAFLEAADQNALDWRLLPSIAYVETKCGQASAHNNLFGWDSGRAHFTNREAAIRSVGSSLAHSSLYRAKSLDRILATYNPTRNYARRVKSVMRQISPVQ
jgi:hypothetical protein